MKHNRGTAFRRPQRTCRECGAEISHPDRKSYGNPTFLVCPNCSAILGGPFPREETAPDTQPAAKAEAPTQTAPAIPANRIHRPTLPWICPRCGKELGPPGMSQITAQERLKLHKRSNLCGAYSTPLEMIEGRPSAKETIEDLAIFGARSAEECLRQRSIPTAEFPFRLLPPGTWAVSEVMGHYRKLSSRNVSGLGKRQFEVSRIDNICSLGATKCWIGRQSWQGYHVFEFANTDRVTLECPFKGNATYVLWDNWRNRISWSKAEIRADHSGSHEVIIHKGDWLARVRAALKIGRRAQTPYVTFVNRQ